MVTGGAFGLGRATALALAGAGNIVAIGDVQNEQGRRTVAEITDGGGTALYHPLDVTDTESVRSFVAKVVDTYGRVDCAVNNAGIEGERHRTHEYPDDDWDRVIAVNLTGVFTCMKHELAVMAAQRSGSIVNVGSTGSLRGIGLMPAYIASKHGVLGITKSAALEYAALNVRVNVICPGGFRTPMSDRLYNGDFSSIVSGTPMGRLAPAEEIAPMIVWLCSDEASFVTGSAYQVDGGRMAGPIVPA